MTKMEKEKNLELIGKTIKMIREQKGLSQEELASRCGYTSRSAINKIELGKTDMAYSKIINISAVLGIHPHILFNSALSDEVVKEGVLNEIKNRYGEDAVKLLELYTSLNDKDKKNAFILINGLVNEKNSQMSSKI